MQKNSFILFNNYKEYFDLLKNEEAGELIKAILNYSNGNKIEKLSTRVECFFVVIKQNLDKQTEEYNKVCEQNKANVAKRWDKQKQKKDTTVENTNTKNTTVEIVKNKNTKHTYNDNDNDKKKDTTLKGSENNKEKNQAETALPESNPKTQQIELISDPQKEKQKKLTKPKKITPQAIIIQYFADKYKRLTGIDYLAVEKDYSIVGKNLTSKYDIELIKQKIDWLEIGCTHPDVYWFAKDINAFTINKLIDRWNEILPVLTDEQKREKAKKQKEQEMQRKVCEELAKQGINIDVQTGKIISAPR